MLRKSVRMWIVWGLNCRFGGCICESAPMRLKTCLFLIFVRRRIDQHTRSWLRNNACAIFKCENIFFSIFSGNYRSKVHVHSSARLITYVGLYRTMCTMHIEFIICGLTIHPLGPDLWVRLSNCIRTSGSGIQIWARGQHLHLRCIAIIAKNINQHGLGPVKSYPWLKSILYPFTVVDIYINICIFTACIKILMLLNI